VDLLAAIGWPVLDRLRLGPLAISPHGIGIAAGYLAGSWWMLREGRKRGMAEDHIGSILVWALLGAIVGARVFYVIGHFSEFDGFVDMLAVWRGGISLIGGIVGAMAVAYPVMRRHGYRFLQVMDSAALGLAFGIALGRVGDLIIGDHIGKPTSFFLGFRYSGGNLAGYTCLGDGVGQQCTTTLADGSQQMIFYGDVVHQTALYDLFIAGFLFLFLFWLNRRPRREGVLIMAFAIWYGAGRVITDLLRVDKTWFGLTGSQWTAIGAIVLSLYTLWRYARKPGPGPGVTAAAANEEPTTAFTPPPEPKG
jgi:phosphatidylglycerol:prolipoprotein diacylglycerol transferase